MIRILIKIEGANVDSFQDSFALTEGVFVYEKENGQFFYKHKLKSKLTISDPNIYNGILSVAEFNKCLGFDVLIQRKCKGRFVDYWRGGFNFFDCKVNKDYCSIEVTPKEKNKLKCWHDFIKNEQDFNLLSDQKSVLASDFGFYQELTCEQGYFGLPNSPTPPPNNECISAQQKPQTWCVKDNYVIIDEQVTFNNTTYNVGRHFTVWQRIYATGICSGVTPIPPDNSGLWSIIANNCPNYSTWAKCPTAQFTYAMAYGRLLNEILIELVRLSNCDLTLISDFFNINATLTGSHINNGAYVFAINNLHHLTLHQKSDVKRPFYFSSNNATTPAWRTKPETIIKDILLMFNLGYYIKDNILRIEHYSFFVSSIGMNLIDSKTFKNKFEFSSNNITKIEKYKFMDEAASEYFLGKNIIYNCGEGEKESRLNLISTDVVFIQDKDNAEQVSDEGFVLVANELLPSGYYNMIDENKPLSWTELHENLFMHGRAFEVGKINNTQRSFLQAKRLKKGEPFDVSLCCDDNFNPNELIKTKLGDSEIKTAEENIFKNNIKLTLLHD